MASPLGAALGVVKFVVIVVIVVIAVGMVLAKRKRYSATTHDDHRGSHRYRGSRGTPS